jgi:small-conductance mechanosensitive channel
LPEYLQLHYARFLEFQEANPTTAAAICTLCLLLGLALALLLIRFLVGRFVKRVSQTRWASEGIRYRSWTLFPPETVRERFESSLWFLFGIVRFLAWVVFALAAITLFPQTARFSNRLFTFLSEKLEEVGLQVLSFVPNIIFIAIIAFLTLQVLKLLKAFMEQIEQEKLNFAMFPAEYAAPTRQLLNFFIIIFAMIIVAPYLPGAGTQAFQGVTLFLGILVSLGSSSAIANMIASFVLQYMRAFKVGDMVEIGGQVGKVTAVTLFSTRLRSLTNEEVAIPNTLVLTSAMKNYSRSDRVAVKCSVSIGYDVPWQKVHEGLLGAARKMEGVLTEPEPFVLQKSLDDNYVSYEVYAYTADVNRLPHLRSRLNEAIQTTFAEAHIEILSPAFTELRGRVQAVPA